MHLLLFNVFERNAAVRTLAMHPVIVSRTEFVTKCLGKNRYYALPYLPFLIARGSDFSALRIRNLVPVASFNVGYRQQKEEEEEKKRKGSILFYLNIDFVSFQLNDTIFVSMFLFPLSELCPESLPPFKLVSYNSEAIDFSPATLGKRKTILLLPHSKMMRRGTEN